MGHPGKPGEEMGKDAHSDAKQRCKALMEKFYVYNYVFADNMCKICNALEHKVFAEFLSPSPPSSVPGLQAGGPLVGQYQTKTSLTPVNAVAFSVNAF